MGRIDFSRFLRIYCSRVLKTRLPVSRFCAPIARSNNLIPAPCANYPACLISAAAEPETAFGEECIGKVADQRRLVKTMAHIKPVGLSG
jgi:hypothetical protein